MREEEREHPDGREPLASSSGLLLLTTIRCKVRTVPLGERHICFSLNSSTRASSGVMVAHLIPTLYLSIASADSTVTWSLVCGHSGDGERNRKRPIYQDAKTVAKWRSNDAPHRDARDPDQST